MASNLVIVESPAKAKTIEGYLGKDFTVKSSYGHVRDLPKKNLSIDIENNFTPEYIVPQDKKKLVSELKKLASKADLVWLATDEDREGEAISWHLAEALNLSDDKIKRIVFHEITKPAILNAIKRPRSIDLALVNAQQARRVLDRLVGYELSPILWRKVKPSLSAGRVQSVAVRLIVEREREILAFKASSNFRIAATLKTPKGAVFTAEYVSRPKSKSQADVLLETATCSNFSVKEIQKTPGKKSPVPPFTTSTLQQEASRKLGYSVAQTMRLAQKLYEAGKITYMRTDSVNLSEQALGQAKEVIVDKYGAEYHKSRKYTTKSKGAQEAHEAIRPVNMFDTNLSFEDSKAIRLYTLIWKRTLACQMADARIERTTVRINGDGFEKDFVAKGEVLQFEGFLKVYLEGKDDDTEDASGRLPKMEKGHALKCMKITATERFSKALARYNEASLVRKMEELGIGRPSTYAPTISTIQKRGYVEKKSTDGHERKYQEGVMIGKEVTWEQKMERTGAEKNKLFPTDIGTVVNDFLVKYFDQIIDFNFTAGIEEHFDDIADGKKTWSQIIEDFYTPFHTTIENTLENSERATGERTLGEDPESGKPVIARLGRFGPMVQIGSSEDEEKPMFASLKNGQTIQEITLDEALQLFKLPRKLGKHEDLEVIVGSGRYGPYVRVGKTFASIPDALDPMEIQLPQALDIYRKKREEDSKRIIKSFEQDDTLQILNGKYGPYIKKGRKNFKLPKDVEPSALDYEQCIEIIENAPARKNKR